MPNKKYISLEQLNEMKINGVKLGIYFSKTASERTSVNLPTSLKNIINERAQSEFGKSEANMIRKLIYCGLLFLEDYDVEI